MHHTKLFNVGVNSIKLYTIRDNSIDDMGCLFENFCLVVSFLITNSRLFYLIEVYFYLFMHLLKELTAKHLFNLIFQIFNPFEGIK